jgi:hypothetical protein
MCALKAEGVASGMVAKRVLQTFISRKNASASENKREYHRFNFKGFPLVGAQGSDARGVVMDG